jgi:hypothetical protein
MEPKHFLLRVWSVKQDRAGPDVHEPVPPTWEVRADTGPGLEQASLFYHESDPRNLPKPGYLIHITVDECLVRSDGRPTVEDAPLTEPES